MCGLVGIAAIGGDPLHDSARDVLVAMGRAVAHRGPDGNNILFDGPVGLNFRRLVLVGPTSGDQPLFSNDESVALIANGEVYNHRALESSFGSGLNLRTRSDCEILAHLYARDELRFLDDVAGMFAVIIWDRRRNRLVLARDRFGIKPLYFSRTARHIVVASEIKALFEHPECRRELDWAGALADETLSIAPHLTTEPVTSWFRDIEVVPAGGIVVVDLATGSVERSSYWRLPDFAGQEDFDASDNEIVEEYGRLLAASVRDCATADAELGLLLSGGVDSAAVAALATQPDLPQLHTFTILTPATMINGDPQAAHLTAEALGLPNHQIPFGTGLVPSVEQWRDLLWLLETPLCNAEQFYKYETYRYAKQTRPQLRGMLLGQASDEFNGGYSSAFSRETDWSGFERGINQLARGAALLEQPRLAPWWRGETPLLADSTLGIAPDAYPAYVRWKYREIQQYNNWHEDRTAAGNGVEARVPFLDHRLVELLAQIPPHRRAALLWDKTVLRAAVAGVVPASIAARPKVSFFYGEGEHHTHRIMVDMLAQDGGALLEEALAAPGAQSVLDADAARATLRRLRGTPEPFDVEYLLRLVNLGLLDQMTRSLPARPVDVAIRPVLKALPVTDWDTEHDEIMRALAPRPALDTRSTVQLAENVEIVGRRADPDILYVAVDGHFEYVASATDDPAWWRFLQALEEPATIGDLLTSNSMQLADVEESLRMAIWAAVVVLTTPAAEPELVTSARSAGVRS